MEKLTADELNYIGNLVIQTAILSEDNEFKEQVNELVQTGMSEEKAKRGCKKSPFFGLIICPAAAVQRENTRSATARRRWR